LSWEDSGLSLVDLAWARDAVIPLAERLDVSARLEAYAANAWTGPTETKAPCLMLDDVSAIPFLVNIAGVEEYQHRARLRAGGGDLFAAATPSTPGYEEYCRRLDMGEPEMLQPAQVGGALEVARACSEGAVFDRLVARAREAGGLQIHPYMGIEAVWVLAKKLAAAADCAVPVLGPPPPATWIANDKALFSETVTRVLDPAWIVKTRASRDPRKLAEALLELGQNGDRVGLKRTRCASGMGNVHWNLEADGLTDVDAAEAKVRAFLTRTLWDGTEDVLVVVWEDTELSPSTQMWIPPLDQGPPRLDGIYEQILEGAERVFVGSRPSTLPHPVNLALAQASLRVSAAFQALGYVGRCSFDLLVLGDLNGEFSCKFTECNGRWGGTSAPMLLVQRLVKGPRPPYRAQDFVHPDLAGACFKDVLARVGDAVYDPKTGQGQFIFYNVGPLVAGKLDVISLAATQPEAEAGLLERLPKLLGVS
jgi:hypothetical protein